MKKFVSITFIVVVSLLSVFSVNSFAMEEIPSNKTDIEITLAQKWSDEKSDQYTAIAKVEVYGVLVEEGRYYKKGNITALEVPYNSTLTQKIIYKENGTYVYFPQIPFFYIEITEKNNLKDFYKFTFIKSYEKSGYTIEEYIFESSGEKAIFYFKGEELDSYEIISLNGATVATYETISYDVKDEDISLPSFSDKHYPYLSFTCSFWGCKIKR